MKKQRLALGDDRPILSLATGLLIFLPAALISNIVGSLLRYPDIGAAVLFPPYAVTTAMLMVSPRRQWKWYLLVDVVAHFVTFWPQFPLTWVLLADLANIARALVAATLLRRFLGGPSRLDSIAAVLLFVGIAVVVAPAVGATMGAATVMAHGAAESYWSPWRAWFVSNALTGLTMLPGFIIVVEYFVGWRPLFSIRDRVVETLLLLAALCATCAVAFLGHWRVPVLPLYAPLPVLIWAALRFGTGGASLALTAVTFAAIWSLDRGTGPFPPAPLDSNVLAMQVFVLLTTLPVLCLAATASARQSTVDLYRALLASLQDHVAILDKRGVVLEVNDSWRRFAANAHTHPFHRAIEGDGYLVACQISAEHGDATAEGLLAGVSSVLGRVKRRFEIEYAEEHDGRQESYIVSVEALERPDGGAVLTRANVTARRQAQREIEQHRREASYLARVAVLGQLSGAFAHELNQPLTAILSNAEAARQILRRQPPDLDQLADIVRDIIQDDQRAAAVISRLRALLKRGERRIERIDAKELVGEVIELAHTELMTRRIRTHVVVEPGLHPILGDEVQLQQVLLNLVLNGCEAMSSTGDYGRRLVVTAAADATGQVDLAVRDHGSGIPSELFDRLFEPFVTTKTDGLGLGLSISRTIVVAHGGRLWAENNADGGATIHCILPAAGPATQALARGNPTSVAAAPHV